MTERFYVGAILQNREGKYLVAEHVKKTTARMSKALRNRRIL